MVIVEFAGRVILAFTSDDFILEAGCHDDALPLVAAELVREAGVDILGRGC